MPINSLQKKLPFIQEMTPHAKPFLKWAGGKSQLINQIKTYLPQQLQQGTISKYVEPFVGGGAIFFFMSKNFQLREFFIADTNRDLILTYKTIQQDVEALIELLSDVQYKYHQMSSEQQKAYFYNTRMTFNENLGAIDISIVNHQSLRRAAQLIFLNRTCFNGLYRVNSKGEFNVPLGSYKNPKICDAENLRSVAKTLVNTDIHYGDFTACRSFIDQQAFVYFDPPYRPISKTASFNSYSKGRFNDGEQKRLATFCKLVNDTGAKLMLSNSDPHNENPQDNFFQASYTGFTIRKVSARRAINSNGTKRGEVTELLITNY